MKPATTPKMPWEGWKKSTLSSTNGECVEVKPLPQGVGIRDSKNPGPELAVDLDAWRGFIAAIKSGRII